MSDIQKQHNQEQLEAKFSALGCTVLPPEVDMAHPAFMAILLAAVQSKSPLTQRQLRDIIDAHNNPHE